MTERVNRETGEPGWPDLYQLSRPFPKELIEHRDNADYVAHHNVNQRLLSIVGPFDFEVVDVVRGDVPAVAPDPSAKSRRGKAGTPSLHGIIVGVTARLSCEVDGRRTSVTEVGDVGDVHNWAHDGERLKNAASDAFKRCAMRLGLGLHLWSQEHYWLDKMLEGQAGPTKVDPPQRHERGREQRSPAGLGGPGDPAWAGQDGRQ